MSRRNLVRTKKTCYLCASDFENVKMITDGNRKSL